MICQAVGYIYFFIIIILILLLYETLLLIHLMYHICKNVDNNNQNEGKKNIYPIFCVFFLILWQHEIKNSNPFHKICKFTCKNFTYGYHMTKYEWIFFISDK